MPKKHKNEHKYIDLRTPEQKVSGKLRKKIERVKSVETARLRITTARLSLIRPVKSARMDKRLFKKIFGIGGS